MEEKTLITEAIELKPEDILRNPKGRIYKINSYHQNKNSFRLSPYPIVQEEENPISLIITKEALIAKKWELITEKDIKLSA
ncbi:hypothetical protein MYP_128 [Sporocytophaga myxococcoides]|uniref:Uncharacterized protein n=1 Tax=Sporocytophaga myxococcoides TaxID=153721 RepID=A0A098L8R6_9BACT|nr:hypothetical protein [Sporocytophaga myxococcoides]GAL82902.1 hypothetical protein MYP_128 [Sporocytophaga myxococcoides]